MKLTKNVVNLKYIDKIILLQLSTVYLNMDFY